MFDARCVAAKEPRPFLNVALAQILGDAQLTYSGADFHGGRLHQASSARPQRGLDVCSNAFDACESVAKEVFNLPTATFGGFLAEACNNKTVATETINTLEKSMRYLTIISDTE